MLQSEALEGGVLPCDSKAAPVVHLLLSPLSVGATVQVCRTSTVKEPLLHFSHFVPLLVDWYMGFDLLGHLHVCAQALSGER